MAAPAAPVASGFTFLESPRWHDGQLYLSDFYSHCVVSVTPEGKVATVCEVPGQPSGIGWLPDDRMLVVSMKDQLLLRLEPSGELVTHADLSTLAGPGPVNDMVVDAHGRAYVGQFGFDLMGGAEIASTSLLRVDPDGTASVAATDLLFPNGMVITPDGSTLIVAETVGQRLSAFSIGPDGSLEGPREWAKFAEVPESTSVPEAMAAATLLPDGICLDAEGAVWAADALAGRAVRVREGGEIVDTVQTGLGVFACMLGGEDGRTLYLCSAPTFVEHEVSDKTEAVLFATQVDVPHAGRP